MILSVTSQNRKIPLDSICPHAPPPFVGPESNGWAPVQGGHGYKIPDDLSYPHLPGDNATLVGAVAGRTTTVIPVSRKKVSLQRLYG